MVGHVPERCSTLLEPLRFEEIVDFCHMSRFAVDGIEERPNAHVLDPRRCGPVATLGAGTEPQLHRNRVGVDVEWHTLRAPTTASTSRDCSGDSTISIGTSEGLSVRVISWRVGGSI